MLFLVIYHIFGLICMIQSISIPVIKNATLKPVYTFNSTMIFNKTCNDCLCLSLSLSYPLFNCFFSNNTCQIFYQFPSIYEIQPSLTSHIYFPQNIFPNPSQCCMADINCLLQKLNSATITSVSIDQPREIIIDDNRYLVTIDSQNDYLRRFDPTNLTSITNKSLQIGSIITIAYRNNTYYVAPSDSNYISVISSQNLSILNNIALTGVNNPRGIMFLNNGQTMVVTSNYNSSLVFFNQSSFQPTVYMFSHIQVVNYNSPHGIWRVNDSFFYVTSIGNNALYSYSLNNSVWNEKFVFSVHQFNGSTYFTRLTIDEYGRFWISFGGSIVLIYNQQGIILENYTLPSALVFDIKIMDNYLMYFSSYHTNQTFRVEPDIRC